MLKHKDGGRKTAKLKSETDEGNTGRTFIDGRGKQEGVSVPENQITRYSSLMMFVPSLGAHPFSLHQPRVGLFKLLKTKRGRKKEYKKQKNKNEVRRGENKNKACLLFKTFSFFSLF